MGLKVFSADKVDSMIVPCPGHGKGVGARQVIIFNMSDGGVEVFKSERRLQHSAPGVSESKCAYNSSMYLMRSVMNAPKGKAATQAEFFEFQSVRVKKRHLFGDEKERYIFDGMVQGHGKSSFLTRLEFVAGLKDLGSGASKVEIASLVVKEFNNRTKLANSIGRLAAVDLFIGNYDRFRMNGELNNPDNLFFKVKGGKLKLIGLDSFFDTGGHANFALGVDALHWNQQMNLKALVKKSPEQLSYASLLTGTLHTELKSILEGAQLARPDQDGFLFPTVEVGWEVVFGMESGVKELLSVIKSKRGVNKNPLQQGLFERYEKLLSLRG